MFRKGKPRMYESEVGSGKDRMVENVKVRSVTCDYVNCQGRRWSRKEQVP